jgi:hypothetical protein
MCFAKLQNQINFSAMQSLSCLSDGLRAGEGVVPPVDTDQVAKVNGQGIKAPIRSFDGMMQRRKLSQTWLALLFFILCTAILYSLGIGSNIFFEDGDSSSHYLISANAFRHFFLFTHHWGKPFFILVSSPFAAMGMEGMQVFNISCGLGAAWLAFLIAKKFGIKYAPYIIPLTLFAPAYYKCLPTGLTEPFFSLVLTAVVYLFLEKRFVLALLLLSFIPLVRTECILLLQVFGFCLLFYRRVYLAPLLLGGFVFYSIVGYFVYDDLAWLIHHNPYHGVSSYGHGRLFHFVERSASTTGIAMAGAFCGGFLYIVYRLFAAWEVEKRHAMMELILIFGVSIIFVAAHSYLWWKGIMNSAGMLRVVAGIVPLVAIGAVQGGEGLIRLMKMPNRFAHIFMAISTIAIWNHTFRLDTYRPKMSNEIRVLKEAVGFLKERKIETDKVFVTNPKAMVFLRIDPYGRKKYPELYNLFDKNNPAAELDPGSVIIWDSFFGPATGVKLEPFLRSGQFEVLRSYHSASGIKPTERGYFAEVILRRK